MRIVSRETLDGKLSIYVELLLKWQKKINLISGNTIKDIDDRHIKDSLQLVKFIAPETKTIIDIGSGGGLPGIPVAIATGITTYLIESDRRKSIFIEEAIRNLNIDAVSINKRIEATEIINLQQPLIITARALADMNKIFTLVNSFLEKHGVAMYKIILLKGKNVSRETLEAKNHWRFNVEYEKSETDAESSIVIIDKLEKVI